MPDSPVTPPAAPRPLQTVPESALALQAVTLAQASNAPVLAVAGNEQQAYRLEGALRFFASDLLPVLHLPDTETLAYDPFSPHQELLSDRMAAR